MSAAIGSGVVVDLADVIGEKVSAIHPQLQWETGKGSTSAHVFCLTAAGSAELRPLAERWRRAGPPPDTTWQYDAARRRNASAAEGTVRFAGQTVALAETRVALWVDEVRQSVDVAVHHPVIPALPAQAGLQLVYLMLDWLLGEDDVERWLRRIEVAPVDPGDTVSAEALVEVVDSLALRHPEPTWVLMEGRTEGGDRQLALARRPLRWIDDPLLDLHSAVELRYADQRPDGLPTEKSLDRLRNQEERLEAVVGPRGLLLAHETALGRRVLHVYSDSEDQNVTDAIQRWSDSEPDAEIDQSLDPAWTQIRKFT